MRPRLLIGFLLAAAAVGACSGGGSGDDAVTSETPVSSATSPGASPTASPSGTASGSPTASPSATATATATGAHSPTPTPTANPPQANWSWIQANVVAIRCGGTSCHGANAPGGDSLQTYTDVVNAPTSKGTLCDLHTRVKPNDSANSYFYTKLLATPPCGSRMPVSGAGFLSQATTDAIKSWIDGGALNN